MRACVRMTEHHACNVRAHPQPRTQQKDARYNRKSKQAFKSSLHSFKNSFKNSNPSGAPDPIHDMRKHTNTIGRYVSPADVHFKILAACITHIRLYAVLRAINASGCIFGRKYAQEQHPRARFTQVPKLKACLVGGSLSTHTYWEGKCQ